MTRDSYKNINDKDPQTLNLYEYCDNNPVSNTDPSGNDAVTATLGGLSVAADLVGIVAAATLTSTVALPIVAGAAIAGILFTGAAVGYSLITHQKNAGTTLALGLVSIGFNAIGLGALAAGVQGLAAAGELGAAAASGGIGLDLYTTTTDIGNTIHGT